MKINVNKLENPYPKKMKSEKTGIVVMFAQPGVGMVVENKPTSLRELGYYSTNWKSEDFVDVDPVPQTIVPQYLAHKGLEILTLRVEDDAFLIIGSNNPNFLLGEVVTDEVIQTNEARLVGKSYIGLEEVLLDFIFEP